MKENFTKKVLTVLLVVFSLNIGVKAQNVNIPDSNFKNFLLNNSGINTNGDGEISIEEAAAYTGAINAPSYSITDLTGIEAFTALTELNCSWNSLTSLDISANTALTFLDCGYNSLTSLNVSANTALTQLNCYRNSLSGINVSANTNLTTLLIYWNPLTSLDVSKNMNLTSLNCFGSLLTGIDVSANTKLNSLDCSANSITSLDLSANTALTDLSCGSNSLTNLDLSKNVNLSELYCGANPLKGLDVSANTNLLRLSCYGSTLTNLDLSANTALTYLKCSKNLLTSLNVSSNTELTYLECFENSITSLDLSANTDITELHCGNNALISLNVKNGNNSNFTGFDATNNSNLSCILVDNVEYMDANWADGKDSYASFNETICPYTILASVLPANSGTTTGAGSYYSGDNVSLSATANIGFVFANWTEDGIEVSTNESYSFTANSGRILLANFTNTTSISDFKETNGLIIYPNPNKGKFELNFDNIYNGKLDIRIYSAAGTIIKELKVNKTMNGMPYSIDLGSIAAGTYYITITTTKEEISKAIIINK